MTDIDEIRRKRMQQMQQQAAVSNLLKPSHRTTCVENRCPEETGHDATTHTRGKGKTCQYRLTKPEFVDQIEIQLIQLAQAGRVQSK